MLVRTAGGESSGNKSVRVNAEVGTTTTGFSYADRDGRDEASTSVVVG